MSLDTIDKSYYWSQELAEVVLTKEEVLEHPEFLFFAGSTVEGRVKDLRERIWFNRENSISLGELDYLIADVFGDL